MFTATRSQAAQEPVMKKLYILAALLMATTSAHAGGITFQINGERVRVEAPRNCSGISCIKITSPGYTGTLGNIDLKGMGPRARATMTSWPPRRRHRQHPLRPRPLRRSPPLPPDCGDARARSNHRRRREPKLRRPLRLRPRRSPPRLRPHRLRWPQQPRPTRTRRSASGRRKRTRATCASRNAAPICAAIPSTPAKGS